MRPLAERLRALRRPEGVAGERETAPPPPPPTAPAPAEPEPPPAGEARGPEALERLERSLLGGVGAGLTLKERLERLVTATARSRPGGERPASAPAVPIEELIAGRRVTNEHGEFFQVEDSLHLDTWHGSVCLGRFPAVSSETLAVVAGGPGFEGFDPGQAVFLDTETTGLAGGTGTAAFLVGLAWVEGDRIRQRQFFMRDYQEEAALLAGLAEDLRRFRFLVTFNGRPFDVPLLEARYRMNRLRFPLEGARHLDLLPSSRRLWKARLEGCDLQSLERHLLGFHRHGDVPGAEIPALYFDFVRRRDGRAMVRVLEHNRLDVLTLAALTAFACDWVGESRAEDPRDVLSLARVLERAEQGERCEREYRRALLDSPPEVRVGSLLRLAARLKRRGDHDGAAGLWEQAAEAGAWPAFRELAVHHEHRTRDLPRALAAARRGAEIAEGEGRRASVAEDFRRRQARIEARLAGGRGRRPTRAD